MLLCLNKFCFMLTISVLIIDNRIVAIIYDGNLNYPFQKKKKKRNFLSASVKQVIG